MAGALAGVDEQFKEVIQYLDNIRNEKRHF